ANEGRHRFRQVLHGLAVAGRGLVEAGLRRHEQVEVPRERLDERRLVWDAAGAVQEHGCSPFPTLQVVNPRAVDLDRALGHALAHSSCTRGRTSFANSSRQRIVRSWGSEPIWKIRLTTPAPTSSWSRWSCAATVSGPPQKICPSSIWPSRPARRSATMFWKRALISESRAPKKPAPAAMRVADRFRAMVAD